MNQRGREIREKGPERRESLKGKEEIGKRKEGKKKKKGIDRAAEVFFFLKGGKTGNDKWKRKGNERNRRGKDDRKQEKEEKRERNKKREEQCYFAYTVAGPGLSVDCRAFYFILIHENYYIFLSK